MNVSVVVPNYNGLKYLEPLMKQLSSIRTLTSELDDIIVVDNGSKDGSAECAEKLGARVIRLQQNQGFSVAVNRGIRETRSPAIAILNNDVELGSGWFSKLCKGLDQPGVWFATGKLLQASGRQLIDGSFDAVCRGGCAWRCGEGKPDGPLWSIQRTIHFAPFTAIVVRKELFERIGDLDERLESYLEDVDFGLRCAAKGYTGVYIPEAVAYHVGSGTLGRWNPRTVSQIARNQVLLLAKHYPRKLLFRYGWPIAVAHLLWGLIALRHGTGFAFIRGKLEGLRLFGKMRGSPDPAIETVLASSERLILELQREAGFDLYWKIYFALS
jgi:GT2 family glycosyltransferase